MIRSFSWNEFLFLLSAVQWTVALSAIAFVGGAIGGLAVALGRTSDIKPLRYAANGAIQLFQGTPLLMQLFLVFFGVPFPGARGQPLGRRGARPDAQRQRFPRRNLARQHRGRPARPPA